MTATMTVNDNLEGERKALFAFEKIEADLFRVQAFPSGLLRLYGGQIVAQALGAAQLTVPADRMAHSLHAYFAAAGRTDLPIDYRVIRDRDGRSFSSRRVTAHQGETLILTLSCSFQIAEPGFRHQVPMPIGLPEPEDLSSLFDQITAIGDRLPERHRHYWQRRMLIDWRPIEPYFPEPQSQSPPQRHFWFRLDHKLGDDPAEHQRYLTYASDQEVLHTALLPTGIVWTSDHLQTSSLDHAIWFHDRFRVDEWLLFVLDSPSASDARALGRGLIYARDGRLVASVAQEGLIRQLHTSRTGTL